MSDLASYIKRQCVYSKIAEKPIVGQWEHLRIVCIHGYPMTLRGFYMLTSRAIFGNALPMNKTMWQEVHAETKLLCKGLGHILQEGREAHSVIEGIRIAAGWNQEVASDWQNDREVLYKWVESVEEQIAQILGTTLPGPRLQ